MTQNASPRPRRGLALMYVGVAALLTGVSAHFLTDADAWRLLTLAGGVVQTAGWMLYARDGRQS